MWIGGRRYGSWYIVRPRGDAGRRRAEVEVFGGLWRQDRPLGRRNAEDVAAELLTAMLKAPAP